MTAARPTGALREDPGLAGRGPVVGEMTPLFEDTRYNRQELMAQMGPVGQARLAAARVVVIGAGGVKSSLLYQLAAVGVGFLRIIDFDRVELSNLNRQILFTVDDIGENKAIAAARRL